MKKLYVFVFLIFILSISAVNASDFNETITTDNEKYDIPNQQNNLEENNYNIINSSENNELQDNKTESNDEIQKIKIEVPGELKYVNGNISDVNISYGSSIILPISNLKIYENIIYNGGETIIDKYSSAKIYIDNESVLNTTITDDMHYVHINLDKNLDVGLHQITVVLSKKIYRTVIVSYGYSYTASESTYNSTLNSTLNVTKSKIHSSMNNSYSKEKHIVPLKLNIKNDFKENIKNIEVKFYKNNI